MKHLKSYENFNYKNEEELNEKITHKTFKKASKNIKKGGNFKKVYIKVAKDLTDDLNSI